MYFLLHFHLELIHHNFYVFFFFFFLHSALDSFTIHILPSSLAHTSIHSHPVHYYRWHTIVQLLVFMWSESEAGEKDEEVYNALYLCSTHTHTRPHHDVLRYSLLFFIWNSKHNCQNISYVRDDKKLGSEREKGNFL